LNGAYERHLPPGFGRVFFILEFWDAAIQGGDVGAAESLMRPAFPARIL
jgi:hypothetical protein